MTKREKTLAVALGGTFAVLVVIPAIWSVLSGPIVDERKKLNSAQLALKRETDTFDAATEKQRKMVAFKERSLSSNASQASIAYKQWLSDLVEVVVKLNNPQVTPERIAATRDNSFVTVRVKVTGEGSMEQVRELLYRFYRANVLHQITTINVETLDSSSSPRLGITLMAEAMSLRDAPVKGTTLFPRATIVEDVKAGTTEIKVTNAKGFPEKGSFEVRVGDQFVVVSSAGVDVWKIETSSEQAERGTDSKLVLKAGTVVELSPVHPDFAKKTKADYVSLIKLNPFAKPVPYRPKFELIGDKSVIRGGSLSAEPRASGFDVRSGKPKYEVISEVPEGMRFEDGKLSWKPTADAKAGPTKVKFKATAPGLKEPLVSEFELTLKDVNAAPKITPPGEIIATLGQPVTVKVSATDVETEADKLTFKLADPKPEGATIDEKTGEVSFTPAANSQPGTVTLTVSVTDAGEPPQTATLPLSITVQDDTALFTFLTGFVAADNERRAFLYDRANNRTLILGEGKPLKYAGFDARVTSISKDFILFEQKEKTWRLNLGENLRSAKVEAQAAATEKPGAAPGEPPLPEDRVAASKV